MVEKYGLPEKITWSRASPYHRAVLFCRKGIIAHVGGGRYNDVEAHWFFYFMPISLDRCLGEFASEIPAQNPFPDSDVIGSENRWPWLTPNQ